MLDCASTLFSVGLAIKRPNSPKRVTQDGCMSVGHTVNVRRASWFDRSLVPRVRQVAGAECPIRAHAGRPPRPVPTQHMNSADVSTARSEPPSDVPAAVKGHSVATTEEPCQRHEQPQGLAGVESTGRAIRKSRRQRTLKARRRAAQPIAAPGVTQPSLNRARAHRPPRNDPRCSPDVRGDP